MTKITIEFEVDKFTTAKALHELLCLLIHEKNHIAGSMLNQSVIDIKLPNKAGAYNV